MGSRKRRPQSQIPEVNLVPMLDVLMTVLTFFIIISMTLTGQQLLNVQLPQSGNGTTVSDPPEADPFVIGLDAEGQLLLDNETASMDQLSSRLQTYLVENPDAQVILKADRSLDYRAVATLLADLRAIGGNRVSLAME